MPRSRSVTSRSKRKRDESEDVPSYNGYGQTTLPGHPKDSKAADLAAELRAATDPGLGQLLVAFRGTHDAPPPSAYGPGTDEKKRKIEGEAEVEDAHTKAVRIAQQLIDQTVLLEQLSEEARHDVDLARQLLADEPSADHQKLADDTFDRHVMAYSQWEMSWKNSQEAIKEADKFNIPSAPLPALGHDDHLANTTEKRSEEEWDRLEAGAVRDVEEAMAAFDRDDRESTRADEAHMVWVLNGQMDEMDRAAAAAAPVEAQEQLVEFDGVLYSQAW